MCLFFECGILYVFVMIKIKSNLSSTIQYNQYPHNSEHTNIVDANALCSVCFYIC